MKRPDSPGRLRTALLALLLSLSAPALATTPPSKGHHFPAGFWARAAEVVDATRYAQLPWALRLAERRALRMEAAAGKAVAALQADRYVLPVLLGAYTDRPQKRPVADFEQLLFGNPTGSMKAYYDEVSYGQFELTGQVFGWFPAEQNQDYYAASNHGLNASFPNNGGGFVFSVVKAADPSVDFSQFDNDGPDGIPNSGDDDGVVDGVIVVYTGASAAWSPGNDNLWPHASSLGANAFTTNDRGANGAFITVDAYAVCPELAGGGEGLNQVHPVGVYAHEFGHLLGLPDLYDRTSASDGPDFDASAGIGQWDLMATGSWGGDGRHADRPAHPSAWCKMQLGWITPTVVTEDATGVQIRALETHPDAVLLWEDGYQGSRYFLLENRQRTGFDTYLNGDGLLVYHVDENRRFGSVLYSAGSVNDDETHKLVDLEEADGRADLDNNANRSDAGDPFPGSSGNRSFTDATTPNSRDYGGKATGVEVTNISDSGPVMTVDVRVRETLGYLLAYDRNGITGWGWGFQEPTDSWGGVSFYTSAAGHLTGVDAGFRAAGTDYELSVHERFDPISLRTSGQILARVAGTTQQAGWQEIALPAPVAVQGSQTLFVSVKIRGKSYAITFDPDITDVRRSFFSSNGTEWERMGGAINLRARIRTAAEGTGVERLEAGAEAFRLLDAYPNPFRGATTLRYALPEAAHVRLSVYDVQGREVARLVDGWQPAGRYGAGWDAPAAASGVYFYRLTAGARSASGTLTLVR